LWFLGALVLVGLVLAAVIALEQLGYIQEHHGKPFLLVGVLALMPYFYLSFRQGGYVLRG
jgi:hypothetical protein